MTVEMRKLGFQGPELTTIGFGSWAVGGAGWTQSWGPQNDQESIQAVHRTIRSSPGKASGAPWRS